MSNDDYSEDDRTELAIDASEIRSAVPDESSTNPLQKAAPAHIRDRLQAQFEEDDRTVERGREFIEALEVELGGLDLDFDPDATRERKALPRPPGYQEHYEEDRTHVVPNPTRPQQPSGIHVGPRGNSEERTHVAQNPLNQPPPHQRQPPRPQPPRPQPPTPQPPTPQRQPPRSQPRSTAAASDMSVRQLQPKPDRANNTGGLVLPDAASAAVAAPDASEQLRRLGLARREKPNANSIRPNSGFYSLPAANPNEVIPEATVEHVFVDEEKNRAVLGLIVALITGTAASVGLLALAIGRWASPAEMMTWTLLAMVLLGGVVGGISLPENDLRVDGLRKAFLPMGIAVALALISGLVWQIGPMRAKVRWIAPETPEMARIVIEDTSSVVSVTECQKVASKSEIGAWRAVLVDVLVEREELGAQCISTLPTADADKLSATLADQWQKELLDAQDTERACQVADAMRRLDRPEGEIETRLLSCVLKAPSEDVQQCCGVSLAAHVADSGGEWVDSLTQTETYTPDEVTAVGLMTFAFHQEGVTGSQKEFIKAAKFTGFKARRTALIVACDAVGAGVNGLSQHFAASLDESCPIEVAKVPRGREVWLDACVVAKQEIANATPPVDALCKATKTALVTTAVGDASRIIANAAEDRTGAKATALAIDVEGTKAELDKPQLRTVQSLRDRGGTKNRKEENVLGVEGFRLTPKHRGLDVYDGQ